jgi:hypothetical protein
MMCSLCMMSRQCRSETYYASLATKWELPKRVGCVPTVARLATLASRPFLIVRNDTGSVQSSRNWFIIHKGMRGAG